MMNHRYSACLLFMLLVSLGIIALGILWVGVPLLAESSFGPANPSLSMFQRWNYSAQVLLHKSVFQVPSKENYQEIDFEVIDGESVNSVSTRLESAGVIDDATAFRAYLIYKGLDVSIRAGSYLLEPRQTSIHIAEAICMPISPTVPFYIYPGWRAEEIAESLPSSGIEVSPEEFMYFVTHPGEIGLTTSVSGFSTAEGFLFPGEYEIDRKISAPDLVLTFIKRFEQSVDVDIELGFSSQGLSVYEGITLASIIQKETFEDLERGKIASVFYNRLRVGMKLETDPTVQYALGSSDAWTGWWKTPLFIGDLDFHSPYNTYLNSGLPPGPIGNPDMPSIIASASPAQTPYFYFRAKCDGSGFHDFSETYDEHLSKACQ